MNDSAVGGTRKGPLAMGTRADRRASSAAPKAAVRDRGIALVMALLVLLVISVICAALMLSVQVETKISGRDDRRSQALSIAEAGVAEVISRIRSGEVPDTLNPRMVSQVFLIGAGSVPVLGSDSTALPTAQPAGKWLTYSTGRKGDQVLTVTYKTDPARTTIYRYDQKKNPPVQLWMVGGFHSETCFETMGLVDRSQM